MERTRIRQCNAAGAERGLEVVSEGLVLMSGVSSVVTLFACASASVNAPASEVVELPSAEGGVLASNRRNASVSEEAIVENGL